MREISTKPLEVNEHVMIDNVEYVVDKADQDDVCKGCALFRDTAICSDFIGCDGIIFKKVEKEPEYRPYRDTDEMIADWKERFKAKDWPSYSMPLVWVKSKTTSLRVFITAYNMYSVVFGGTRVDFRDLFDNYTYLDDSPCGKEVSP